MKQNEINIEEVLQESKTEPGVFTLGMYNNSHYFLLPLFGLQNLGKYISNYYGTFVGDSERKCFLDSPLFVVFSFDDLESKEVLDVSVYMASVEGYKFSYFGGMQNGKNLIVYVFLCKNKLKKDYKSIIEGRYSEISEEVRFLYSTFPFSKEVRFNIKSIIEKNKDLKEKISKELNVDIKDTQEIWTVFDPMLEVFRYNATSKN